MVVYWVIVQFIAIDEPPCRMLDSKPPSKRDIVVLNAARQFDNFVKAASLKRGRPFVFLLQSLKEAT
jgi:hypothetical protein